MSRFNTRRWCPMRLRQAGADLAQRRVGLQGRGELVEEEVQTVEHVGVVQTPFVRKALAHAPEPAPGERDDGAPASRSPGSARSEGNRSDPVAPFALDPGRRISRCRRGWACAAHTRRISFGARDVPRLGDERNVAGLRGLSIEDRLHPERALEQRDELEQRRRPRRRRDRGYRSAGNVAGGDHAGDDVLDPGVVARGWSRSPKNGSGFPARMRRENLWMARSGRWRGP